MRDFAWTLAHTSVETKAYLATLPFRIDLRPLGGHLAGPSVTLVHGTPTLNTVYWTEDRPNTFCTKMAQLVGARAGDVIAFGHTHKPWHRVVEGVHFVNTGGVGRPKTAIGAPGYVLLDVSSESVRANVVRVEYDIERAMRGILESDLPHEFASYLRTGGHSVAAPKQSSSSGSPVAR